MRRQYHFRRVGNDTYIWDVHHLVALSRDLPIHEVLLSEIQELHEAYWFPDTHPTTQQILEHVQLIQAADFAYPILLSADGRVMDGMHRVAKAKLLNHQSIHAVRFDITPPPDYLNVDEDDLDYGDDLTDERA
ncbi:hypothetical protein ACG9YX_00855 [Acinetobacter nematophilus]|uniref:hypothetical protein n=1 Tax=Acinetobacter TaxID=469 RepID=UPI00258FEA10|nr:hypothetical protein [Acinetobacter sp.]